MIFIAIEYIGYFTNNLLFLSSNVRHPALIDEMVFELKTACYSIISMKEVFMKKKVFILAGLFIFFVFISSALCAEFVASKNATTYHYPTCRLAKKISEANLIKFANPAEAKKAGYQPCKTCKPPMPE